MHHGNGTQQIFLGDARVLTLSVHRRDPAFYPQGVGYPAEARARARARAAAGATTSAELRLSRARRSRPARAPSARGHGFVRPPRPQVGEGGGAGFNVNVGWPSKGFGDADYLVSGAPLALLAAWRGVRLFGALPRWALARSANDPTPHPLPRPQAAYDLVLEPIIAAFAPQLIIIAAGFDAVAGDPWAAAR